MKRIVPRHVNIGIVSFVGTATTLQVSAGGLKFVRAFSLSLIGTPGANDVPLSLNNTVVTSTASGELLIQVPQSGANAGKVTLTRPANGTSGQKVSVVLEGY